ncbi:MAG TPA: hypothetical protein HPP94_04215 [Desulfuromonadales bacterium]|nr:hypothetical protein [Desulfuromonadales bacterium]
MAETASQSRHPWKFFRAGGFDQVLLESGEDLLALAQLDKKLWSALSCPIKGIEFDQRTLQLIDSDADGHIRVPEVLAAVEWAGRNLSNHQVLITGAQGVPLSAISTATEEGQRLLNAARTVLVNLGKADADRITVEDTADNEAILSQTRFNGDGIITAASTDDEKLKGWIADIITCLEGAPDRSGVTGVSRAQVEQFSQEVSTWLAWNDEAFSGGAIRLPEGGREEAIQLWHTVKPKVEDFFLRCSMAAYDSRAATLMNSSDEILTALAPRNLTDAGEEIAGLPLATVTVQENLDLESGLNPAWRLLISQLRTIIIQPILGERSCLTAAEWSELKRAVQEYELWWGRKIETTTITLGTDRMRQWLTEEPDAKLLALIDQDLALQPAFEAIVEVERLTRYCRDLLPLANNFVSFRDFYTGHGKAIFQAGTLYLDGRSFELCITVNDVAKHAVLASLSRVYLAYCDCVRHGGTDKMTIAAAITDGDCDQLLVGRNGIFYDRQGQDWDATIVRIVDHPISIRQAFWAPYKRIFTTIGEQLQKMAAARSKAAEDKAAVGLMQTTLKKDAAKPAPPPFDVGKFAGIFAAIGLAVGALATAVASILTGFLKLPWWQMPLAVAGIILLISGPSILIAWFKLRQRNLGRLLDANGWAVNTRARINIPFGASLTTLARLPLGAALTMADPFAEKKRPWKSWLVLLIICIVVISAWRMGYIPLK